MPALEPDEPELTMSFGDHLEELRRRLIYGLISIGITSCIALYFGQDIIAWLQAPLNHVQREAGLPAMTIAPSVTTGFSIYMKVGLVTGLIVGSPLLVYQLWKFVSTGLYDHERRVAMLLMPFSLVMTTAGVLFTYFIMLPLTLAFLIGFTTSYPAAGELQPGLIDRVSSALTWWMREPVPPPAVEQPDHAPEPGSVLVPTLNADPTRPAEGQVWINAVQRELKIHYQGHTRTVTLATGSLITPLVGIDDYINFVAFMGLGVVLSFQLPLVMLVLGWTGVVPPSFVARYRRHCIFICFALGAVLTPSTDVVSMMVMSLPLWGLFEFGLVLMRLNYRPRSLPW